MQPWHAPGESSGSRLTWEVRPLGQERCSERFFEGRFLDPIRSPAIGPAHAEYLCQPSSTLPGPLSMWPQAFHTTVLTSLASSPARSNPGGRGRAAPALDRDRASRLGGGRQRLLASAKLRKPVGEATESSLRRSRRTSLVPKLVAQLPVQFAADFPTRTRSRQRLRVGNPYFQSPQASPNGQVGLDR